jgi:hypothetical protein
VPRHSWKHAEAPKVTSWRDRAMTTAKPTFFHCPDCNALYQVVKTEAGPETVDQEITCRGCGAPWAGREGKFVLKYFLLRKSSRVTRTHKSGSVNAIR